LFLSQVALLCYLNESISFLSGYLKWSLSISLFYRIFDFSLIFTSLDRTDIRKPATHKAQIQRPLASSNSNTAPGTPSDARSSDQDPVQYTEPVSDDEDADDDRFVGTAVDEAAWAQLPPEAAAEAKAHREELAKSVKATISQQGGATNGDNNGNLVKQTKEMFPKLTPANLVKLLESRYDREGDRGLNESGEADPNASGFSVRPGRTEYVSSFRAQQGKRIAIPVRVEPKVFYANERTSKSLFFVLLRSTSLTCFLPVNSLALAWIEFSVVVSAIGIGILSFSDPHGKSRLSSFLLSGMNPRKGSCEDCV